MTLEMTHMTEAALPAVESVQTPTKEEVGNPYRKLPDHEVEDAYEVLTDELRELTAQISALEQRRMAAQLEKIQVCEVMNDRAIDRSRFHPDLYNPDTMNPRLFGTDNDYDIEVEDTVEAINDTPASYEVSAADIALAGLAHTDR